MVPVDHRMIEADAQAFCAKRLDDLLHEIAVQHRPGVVIADRGVVESEAVVVLRREHDVARAGGLRDTGPLASEARLRREERDGALGVRIGVGLDALLDPLHPAGRRDGLTLPCARKAGIQAPMHEHAEARRHATTPCARRGRKESRPRRAENAEPTCRDEQNYLRLSPLSAPRFSSPLSAGLQALAQRTVPNIAHPGEPEDALGEGRKQTATRPGRRSPHALRKSSGCWSAGTEVPAPHCTATLSSLRPDLAHRPPPTAQRPAPSAQRPCAYALIVSSPWAPGPCSDRHSRNAHVRPRNPRAANIQSPGQ